MIAGGLGLDRRCDESQFNRELQIRQLPQAIRRRHNSAVQKNSQSIERLKYPMAIIGHEMDDIKNCYARPTGQNAMGAIYLVTMYWTGPGEI
jgi:hypothetical protein